MIYIGRCTKTGSRFGKRRPPRLRRGTTNLPSEAPRRMVRCLRRSLGRSTRISHGTLLRLQRRPNLLIFAPRRCVASPAVRKWHLEPPLVSRYASREKTGLIAKGIRLTATKPQGTNRILVFSLCTSGTMQRPSLHSSLHEPSRRANAFLPMV